LLSRIRLDHHPLVHVQISRFMFLSAAFSEQFGQDLLFRIFFFLRSRFSNCLWNNRIFELFGLESAISNSHVAPARLKIVGNTSVSHNLQKKFFESSNFFWTWLSGYSWSTFVLSTTCPLPSPYLFTIDNEIMQKSSPLKKYLQPRFFADCRTDFNPIDYLRPSSFSATDCVSGPSRRSFTTSPTHRRDFTQLSAIAWWSKRRHAQNQME
jgi:hypothetical protein